MSVPQTPPPFPPPPPARTGASAGASRSRRRSLIVTSLVAVAAGAALIAWGDDSGDEAALEATATPEPLVATPADCAAVAAPGVDCAALFTQAQSDHAAAAPHYLTAEACAATHGASACAEDAARPGLFMPVLAGFLLGQALDASGRAIPRATPVYVDRSGALFAGGQSLTGAFTCGPGDPRCAPPRGSGAGSSSSSSSSGVRFYSYSHYSGGRSGATHSARSSGGFGATGGHAHSSGG